ncbi:MAG: carboxylating nicotinate-nucleotide diphosphorylase [Candidatus Nitrohelix vancouverensis]|uniref:Probable nicotinate-nucleotide pyrophosphorylase [carboxylating] n=1 Tax=Candidatus Nitrohelix vancouverensis TaxID=2705534 RepID=A0A7T0G3Y5_9BACT|nr:MAG: carboxylating nicotinate-nucleotide diphosphorylase [Candidatus Nitrohelix vancouverensis]
MHRPSEEQIQNLLNLALQEDVGTGDITTRNLIPEGKILIAETTAKEHLTLCGRDFFQAVFKKLDPEVQIEFAANDGQEYNEGDLLFRMRGQARALLEGERTALNVLQHLSGIATLTRAYAERAKPATLLDTRKTWPGLRTFQKYAVACGGGSNHRFGLYDAVLIKDNHIKAVGSIAQAVSKARDNLAPGFPVEVETSNLQEVQEAVQAKAEIIMLDNMSIETIQEALKIIDGKARTEASGNVRLENLHEIASTGVDSISVGRITHSAPSIDISMNFIWEEGSHAL